MSEKRHQCHKLLTDVGTKWCKGGPLLVAAVEEIAAPDHVRRTRHHVVAVVQQQLSQAQQRLLHEEAQRVLQLHPHQGHESVQLGDLVQHPGGLVHVVHETFPHVGTYAVAQRDHPRLPKVQVCLEEDKTVFTDEKLRFSS